MPRLSISGKRVTNNSKSTALQIDSVTGCHVVWLTPKYQAHLVIRLRHRDYVSIPVQQSETDLWNLKLLTDIVGIAQTALIQVHGAAAGEFLRLAFYVVESVMVFKIQFLFQNWQVTFRNTNLQFIRFQMPNVAGTWGRVSINHGLENHFWNWWTNLNYWGSSTTLTLSYQFHVDRDFVTRIWPLEVWSGYCLSPPCQHF